MEYLFLEDRVIIKNPSDFSLTNIFDCGQCFRFNETKDAHFIGVAFNKVADLYMENSDVVIKNITKDEFLKNWVSFLDLERDYSLIKKALNKDEVLNKAIEYGSGIRILKQDFFECLISFIMSQQNNIPRIKKLVEGFCELFGEKLYYNDKEYYTFPDVTRVKDITVNDLAPLKLGYRDKYVIDGIKKVANGEISYDLLNSLSYKKAKDELMKINGVGNKVADCVLLFSLLKGEAFPVDTWIKKAMEGLYNIDTKDIDSYARLNFMEYSGFAQQYIFYYIRNKK